MKKINLEEIFMNNFDCYTEFVDENWQPGEDPAMSREKFVKIVKSIVEQALELAAENAEADLVDSTDDSRGLIIIDKDSILNTINQIE